jgi:3-hydroxyacyl-CoA dehydrogenase
MYIFKAAVVGAGWMGGSIAQVITFSGLPVVLKDVDQKFLDKGVEALRSIYQRRVDAGKMSTGEMQEKLSLVTPTLAYDDFGDVDIVIEAVPEVMKIKKTVWAELDKVCPEHTIFASNTSALSISEMGAATKRPQKMIGMHFFSPAHVMKLVEIIPGLDTSQETVDDVVAFTESLRKIAVVVQECPGFLGEAALSLQEGAASSREIDDEMVNFGWPMGPFTLMDMLGIDVIYHTAEYLGEEYGVETPALFKTMFDAGRLGEKAGAGFYGYGDQTDEPVKAMIKKLQDEGKAQKGTEFSWQRLMMALVNEAIQCVTENIAPPDKIDMSMIAGTGMKYGEERIGPLQFADIVGLDVVLAELEKLRAKYGNRFRPARLLKTKVRAGHLGKKVGRGFFEYTV